MIFIPATLAATPFVHEFPRHRVVKQENAPRAHTPRFESESSVAVDLVVRKSLRSGSLKRGLVGDTHALLLGRCFGPHSDCFTHAPQRCVVFECFCNDETFNECQALTEAHRYAVQTSVSDEA